MAWLALAIVLGQFALVVARYVFGLGSIWLTEAVTLRPRHVVHAGRGLDAAPRRPRARRYFLRRRQPRAKAAVDFLGALLLLLPFTLVVCLFAAPYAARSWAILERSQEVGGLPLVFVLKTLIPLFAALLACKASRRRSAPAQTLVGPR